MKQGTPRVGYRQVTLLDRRGRVLAFAESLAIHGHTVGITRASLSPVGALRLTRGRAQVTVTSAGRAVLVLIGLRLTIHTGAQRARNGTWVCDAAVGAVRAVQRRGV